MEPYEEEDIYDAVAQYRKDHSVDPPKAQPKISGLIKLPTNYNKKLGCDAILHIAPATRELIPESKMKQAYEFVTSDGSHPSVVYYLHDVARMELKNIPECYTWASHGMSRQDFCEWYLQKHPVNGDMKMAVYFYHKQK